MKNSFLESEDKSKCCGCNACIQACPNRCLEAISDSEGFNYPILKHPEKCIDCSKCRNVCPMEKNDFLNPNRIFYGMVNKNKSELLKSSSGGVFVELAKTMINDGGIVYGVALIENQAVYRRIDRCEELDEILGSKYIQANSQSIYINIKTDLELGIKVLICGTPCFIAGLKKFLKKEYDGLITVDLICHGVPSQKIFDKYIEWLEKKRKGHILDFKFLDNSTYGWGISATYKFNNKIKSELTVSSPYIWAYLKNYLHRPSCYTCPYASDNRPGEITLGDFWEMDRVGCQLNSKDGISLVKINNATGKAYLENIKSYFFLQEMEYEGCIYTNGALYEPSKKENNRELIYKNIDGMTFDLLITKYFNMPNQAIVKIKKMIPPSIKKYIKSIVKYGEKEKI